MRDLGPVERAASAGRYARAAALMLALVLGAASAHVRAQAVQLPLDLGQGVLFPEHGRGPDYRFAPTLAPELRWNRVRLGLPLGASGPTPWRLAAGLRPSLRVAAFEGLSDLSVWIALQGAVQLPHPRFELQAGPVAELLFLRLGLWAGRLFGNAGRWTLVSSIGIDVASLARLLGGGKSTDPSQDGHAAPRPQPSELTLLRSEVRSRVLGIPLMRLPPLACWVRAHGAELDACSRVSALRELAKRAGQPEIDAALAQAALATPAAGDGPAAAAAARDGLRSAAEEVDHELHPSCP